MGRLFLMRESLSRRWTGGRRREGHPRRQAGGGIRSRHAALPDPSCGTEPLWYSAAWRPDVVSRVEARHV